MRRNDFLAIKKQESAGRRRRRTALRADRWRKHLQPLGAKHNEGKCVVSALGRAVGVLAAALIIVAAVLPYASSAAPLPASDPPSDVLNWTRTHAIPFRDGDGPLSPAEADAVRRLVGGAKIFAVGEPSHGAHQPLVQRNRLIRFAVEHLGVTAVTLESGLAQGRRIDAYTKGGGGDVVAIAHDNLDWTFGDLTSNIALMQWLRSYNGDPSHHVVSFYGADISGGDDHDTVAFAGLVVDDLVTYLSEAAPKESQELRQRLIGFSKKFDSDAYRDYSASQRSALSLALQEARRLLARRKAHMVAASSQNDYDWAVCELVDAQRLQTVFGLWPGPKENQLPGLLKVSEIRDREMADVALWALKRAGPYGRVFSFAHDNHVASVNTLSKWVPVGTPPLHTMGVNLHAALGRDYRVLLQASALNENGAEAADHLLGTVDKLFVASGPAPLFLSLHKSPTWWNKMQTTRMGFNRVEEFVPAQAADAILYLPPLTCDPTTRPTKNDCKD